MKAVLISGANRGIGLEFVKELAARGMRIFATCRHPGDAEALQQLSQSNENISIHQLDVTKDEHIQDLAKQLSETPIDWLINNAGIGGEKGVTIGNIDRENFLHVLDVNCVGALKLSDALLPQIKKSQDKLIICISSRMGSISDNDTGQRYAYRTSKAALNCAMRSFALDVEKDDVNVMLLHPGWVETDLGGEEALLTPEQSVSSMLEVIDRHKADSHAEVLLRYDGGKIDW